MDNSFKMLIRPAYFAPILSEFKDNKPVHSMAYGKCNYRCAFCSFDKWTVDIYPEFTLETFEKKVWELLRYSKNFKFTGGEPTLNPYLPELLKIVKLYGAHVYLDTNGSRPERIKSLVDEGLVDILGISLKGLSAEEAAKTARITNKKMCWDNVFESIKIGSEAENVHVILTYVACDGHFNDNSLDVLADKLNGFLNVNLKINNCYHEEYNDGRRKGLDKTEIYSMVERFVERHPEFKGRTVLFRDHDSCVDQSKIALF
ncbi:MAG: radical SAM protein [Ruminococcus sp.]|nr:radical SAM protein [Ruminococcus sp.]